MILGSSLVWTVNYSVWGVLFRAHFFRMPVAVALQLNAPGMRTSHMFRCKSPSHIMCRNEGKWKNNFSTAGNGSLTLLPSSYCASFSTIPTNLFAHLFVHQCTYSAEFIKHFSCIPEWLNAKNRIMVTLRVFLDHSYNFGAMTNIERYRNEIWLGGCHIVIDFYSHIVRPIKTPLTNWVSSFGKHVSSGTVAWKLSKCLRNILHCGRLSSITVLLIYASYDTSCKRMSKKRREGNGFAAAAMPCATKEMQYVSGALRSMNSFRFRYMLFSRMQLKFEICKTGSAENFFYWSRRRRQLATERECCEWVEQTNGTIVHFSLLNQALCGFDT